MGQLFADISARIPANKFYPPRFASTQNVFRPRLVEGLLQKTGCGKKVFLIEAQAGQGKTTLAAQYLQHTESRYTWYQVGPEDSDPILFLTALLVSLKKVLPSFASPQLEKMIAAGEVTVLELPRYVNILLADLDASLHDDFFVVFDDFHLLDGCKHSLTLVDYLLKTAPPRLRFILISRRAIPLADTMLQLGRDALFLDNGVLAMSESETAELLNGFLETPLPRKTVRQIHHATDGWVMGLILAGHALGKEREIGGLRDVHESLKNGRLPLYFKEEILAQLPEALQLPLLKLSLLVEIPVPLARLICDDPAIDEKLADLMQHNFFVRSLDERNTIFALHHLFQEFLQERARQQLSEEERTEIYEQAASFWLERKRPQTALVYYLKAGRYAALEKVLEQEGMALLAMNRVATLSTTIKQIPEPVIKKSGWFSYFAGVAAMLEAPKGSLPFFEIARINFIKEENTVGELLAIAELINFHMAFDGAYNKGLVYLRRAEELFAQKADDLDTYTKILVAHDIASGFCFFEMNMQKSAYYSSYGLKLAQRHGLDNYAGRIRIVQGFAHLLMGRYDRSREIAEKSYALIWSPRVDVVSRIGLRTLLLDLLEKAGDFENFASLQAQSYSSSEGALIPGTITGPLLTIWNADVAIAQGRIDDAEKILRQGLQTDYGARSHLRSQFLHYLAFVYGAKQLKGEAVDALEESRQLRAEVGGPYYLALNDLICGATYGQLRMKEQAEAYLTRTIEGAHRIGVEYFLACAFLQRAFLRIATGEKGEAKSDLAQGLAIMRENGYSHFHAWTPAMAGTLLATAVQQGIEVEFARKLAAERLGAVLLPNGAVEPLLKIRVLGTFAIEMAGKVVLKTEDFTPAQRQFLALLITSPDLKMRQEHIQVSMWPDSEAAKARSKLDSLLNRLRKTLSQALGEAVVKRCFGLKKGILCLTDCLVDALEFRRLGRKGLEFAKRGEWWQAGNAFQGALRLWQGCFLNEVADDEQVFAFCSELRELALTMAATWGDTLVGLGRCGEAVAVHEQALQHDPLNDVLVQKLYQLHMEQKETANAQAVLRRYRQALQRADYPAEEIDEMARDVCQGE